MTWNPSPEVARARDLAKEWGKTHVIIIALDVRENTIESASYGRTRAECAEAKGIADACYDAAHKHVEQNW